MVNCFYITVDRFADVILEKCRRALIVECSRSFHFIFNIVNFQSFFECRPDFFPFLLLPQSILKLSPRAIIHSRGMRVWLESASFISHP